MTRFYASLLAIILPSQGLADGLKYVPKWTLINNKACYEFDDARKLIEIDLRLDRILQEEAFRRAQLEDLKQGLTALDEALTLEKNTSVTLKKENTQLAELLIKEKQRVAAAEAKKTPRDLLIVGGAGLLVVGLMAGVIVGVYVTK